MWIEVQIDWLISAAVILQQIFLFSPLTPLVHVIIVNQRHFSFVILSNFAFLFNFSVNLFWIKNGVIISNSYVTHMGWVTPFVTKCYVFTLVNIFTSGHPEVLDHQLYWKIGPGFVRILQKFSSVRKTSFISLTLSWRRLLSYRNQSIDLQSKSVDWFLYDNGLRHERVNVLMLKNKTGVINIK